MSRVWSVFAFWAALVLGLCAWMAFTLNELWWIKGDLDHIRPMAIAAIQHAQSPHPVCPSPAEAKGYDASALARRLIDQDQRIIELETRGPRPVAPGFGR